MDTHYIRSPRGYLNITETIEALKCEGFCKCHNHIIDFIRFLKLINILGFYEQSKLEVEECLMEMKNLKDELKHPMSIKFKKMQLRFREVSLQRWNC